MSTHKEIAKLAGVSLSTVSKALTGSAEVSKKTREKVISIAEELGYFKDKTERKLYYTKHHSINIAIVYPEIRSLDFSTVITALSDEIASRGGNSFICFDEFTEESLPRLIQRLTVSGFVDGIIIIEFDIPEKFPIPIVSITAKMDLPYDTVGVSGKNLEYQMITYLKEKGHRKIGYVGEPLTKNSEDAFTFTLYRCNLELNKNFIYVFDKRFEDAGIAAANVIAKQKDRPTAVFAAYPEIAVGLIHQLKKLGISVPDDISVVTRNEIPICKCFQVPLTTFDLHNEKLAKSAIDLIYNRITNNDCEIKHIVFDYKFIERNSVKDINSK